MSTGLYLAGALTFLATNSLGSVVTNAAGHNTGAWIEAWLSETRFARYLAEASGDRGRALDLYEWNLRIGAALMRDIAHIEVAIRNAYDQAMQQHWHGTGHWLLDPTSPVLTALWRTRDGRRSDMNARNRSAVTGARSRCGGASASPGQVIAELSFGFWRHCNRRRTREGTVGAVSASCLAEENEPRRR